MKRLPFLALLLVATTVSASEKSAAELEQRFIQIDAKTKEARTLAETAGMSIESIRSDSAWGFADAETIRDLQSQGLRVLGDFDFTTGRGGHSFTGFPQIDERYHDYAELRAELTRMEKENPELAKLHVIGQSLEGRDILALQINSSAADLTRGESFKPGAIYMGGHHAREHLSVEVPLMAADYLLKNKADPKISVLLTSRDIWFIPLVNPDGAEFDISKPKYGFWRKNRRLNADGTYGVDLNRNYGYLWGTLGAASKPNSDTFRGTAAFSEPETQVIKNFVDTHLNAKMLLSFHTFSEQILYPWSGTFDALENKKDLAVFEKMADTMASWNGYKPMQSSATYVASGDTCDWAYGEHGIFAFTFELSPKEITQGVGGGFYPGPKWVDSTFAANLKPVLYMLDLADDPYRAVTPALSFAARNRFELHPM